MHRIPQFLASRLPVQSCTPSHLMTKINRGAMIWRERDVGTCGILVGIILLSLISARAARPTSNHPADRRSVDNQEPPVRPPPLCPRQISHCVPCRHLPWTLLKARKAHVPFAASPRLCGRPALGRARRKLPSSRIRQARGAR